jgi:hypothetical protein
MRNPSIQIAIFTLIFTPFLPAQDAQDPTPQAQPAMPPAAVQTEEKQTVAPPAAMSQEIMKLIGFPKMAAELAPALAAAVQMTPEQQQALKQAMEETVDQAKKDMAGNDDQKQAYRNVVRAQNDYASRRDSILGDQQVNLISSIRAAFIKAFEASKQARSEPGKKLDMNTLFLKELKPCLDADQVARIEATGVKFPEP